MAVLFRRRVAVPAQHARCGRQLLHRFLHALCADPKVLDAAALADGAHGGDRLLVVAVVAGQALAREMVGQGDLAVRAADDGATVAAHDKGGGASPVQKEDDLFVLGQGLLDLLLQAAAEHGSISRAQFVTHVDHVHRGEIDAVYVLQPRSKGRILDLDLFVLVLLLL